MADLTIREATLADAPRIARLVSELGYPTSSTQMAARLKVLLADADYDTLVAREGDEIVGFIGTRVGRLYESDDPYGQIVALAVATPRQRSGVGRSLLEAAEANLTRRGARVLVVASGNHRSGAHAFYESNGYTFTGRRYKKTT